MNRRQLARLSAALEAEQPFMTWQVFDCLADERPNSHFIACTTEPFCERKRYRCLEDPRQPDPVLVKPLREYRAQFTQEPGDESARRLIDHGGLSAQG